MSVKIKLIRTGRKKSPSYRIVAAEQRSKVTGKVNQSLGFYDPKTSPAKIKIDHQSLEKWLSRGAKPTEAVRKLLKL